MNYNKIVCVDMEMCCWEDKPIGSLIEFSLASINIKKGEIDKRSQFYIKPVGGDEISEFCTNLTGITQKVIDKQAMEFYKAYNKIVQRYGTQSLYVSWGDDAEYLRDYMTQLGSGKFPFSNWINFATIFGIENRVKSGSKLGMRKALEMKGLEFEGRQHSGYDDAYNLARLVMTSNIVQK